MPNDNTHTLLPCPFCGGPAEMVRRSGVDYGINEYRVVCGGCGIGTEYVSDGTYKPKKAGGRPEWCANDAMGRLIQIWNTRTPAEPKAECKGYMCNRGADGADGPFHYGCDTCGRALSSMNPCYSGEMCIHVPYAEPKAGDWDAVLLDTLLYSQGHGIKTPPHEDPSDILDEYEKSIPDGAYRESIRSIRRALSSAAPRITEEMVERLPRGFIDVGNGYIRFDDELVFRKDVIALLRQQGAERSEDQQGAEGNERATVADLIAMLSKQMQLQTNLVGQYQMIEMAGKAGQMDEARRIKEEAELTTRHINDIADAIQHGRKCPPPFTPTQESK